MTRRCIECDKYFNTNHLHEFICTDCHVRIRTSKENETSVNDSFFGDIKEDDSTSIMEPSKRTKGRPKKG